MRLLFTLITYRISEGLNGCFFFVSFPSNPTAYIKMSSFKLIHNTDPY